MTAIDRDGFSSTHTQSIRVKDPLDTQAPVVVWSGALAGLSAVGQPLAVRDSTGVQASLQEIQLMGYKLEMAPASASMGVDNSAWITLAAQESAASNTDQTLTLATLDPARLANGTYQLRLSAWDLVGRTTSIEARITIDTEHKVLSAPAALDARYSLAGHRLALTRVLDVRGGAGARVQDFGNWRIPALDTGLTSDQPGSTASGAVAPLVRGCTGLA